MTQVKSVVKSLIDSVDAYDKSITRSLKGDKKSIGVFPCWVNNISLKTPNRLFSVNNSVFFV